MSSLRLSPLPDFLRGEAKWGEADAGNVGEGALSMPDADVTGTAAAEVNLAKRHHCRQRKGCWLRMLGTAK